MSSLPKGWETCVLGEVSNVVRGITFPASAKEPTHTNENVCCLRTSNIQREVGWEDIYFVPRSYVKRQDQFVQVGDVLMSMANSYELVGKVALAKEMPYPTAFGAFLSAIRPTEFIHGKYLFHWLRTNQVQSELRQGSSQTTNIANISVGKLSEITTPLAPLPEQKRIAAKLDATLARVDACRARLARVAPILKRFRQSVLAAATSGQFTADWREQQGYGHAGNDNQALQGNTHAGRVSEALPDSNVGWADEGSPTLAAHDERWASQAQPNLRANQCPNSRELLVDELATLIPGFAFKSDSFQKEGEYRVLKLANVKDGFVSLNSGDSYLPEDVALQSSKFMVKKNDILIAMTGTKYKRDYGFVALVNEPNGMFANQRVGIIRVNQRITLASYAFICFRSESFRNQFFEGETGGVNQGNVGAGHIKSCKINVPPLAEQTEIVRRVETLFAFADRLEARLASASAAAERLTPSLLAKAFRGELVPQYPNDEPASELLQRLAASRLQERAAAGGKPKRGRKAST